jgi:type IV pilus assembly protein PilP
MAGSTQRLGWLVVFFFLCTVVAAQEKIQPLAQQGRDGVDKQPSAPRAVVKTVPDVGAAKSKPEMPVRDEESVKSKGEATADAEKSPALAPRVSTPGKRDPFRPFTLNARGGSARRRENLSPLERYELGQLKLVGVIWDVKEPNAMVEDAAGLGYRVKVGTPIGSNEGKVKTILQDGIVVEEFQVDLYGAKNKREVKIRLSPEKAE